MKTEVIEVINGFVFNEMSDGRRVLYIPANLLHGLRLLEGESEGWQAVRRLFRECFGSNPVFLENQGELCVVEIPIPVGGVVDQVRKFIGLIRENQMQE